jgi:18S rRNA (guanine1575-N7)-methyltransferase
LLHLILLSPSLSLLVHTTMSRPELTGHASLFYNEKEARKYHSSSRMMGIQREITERAIELLRLDEGGRPSLILDIGCGSGLSGQVLEERGHVWVGCDVSRDMLTVAQERIDQQTQDVADSRRQAHEAGSGGTASSTMQESDDEGGNNSDYDDEDDNIRAANEPTGDLLHHDMGTGLPFRPATFDACISISALQWLCYSNAGNQNPRKRLLRFFSSLYSVLKRGGRAVLQFYPETAEQAVLISETATQVGFAGGVVVDYPNSAKAKKHYLVLSFDRGAAKAAKEQAITAAAGTQVHVADVASSSKKGPPIRKKKGSIKTKEWILHKKETQRKKGKTVRHDSKYTARRRRGKF